MKFRVGWIAIGIVTIAALLAAIYFGSSKVGPPESSARLLLNEVRFLPAEDLPAFVEIVNAGSASTTLDGVSLRNAEGESFALPPAMSIAAGAYLLLLFDGATVTEERAVHAPVGNLLRNDGALWLLTAEGATDGIAWGVNRPAAVELCRGGRCEDPAPGSVIARLPGVVSPLTIVAWAPLDPEGATPGQPNPQPPVASFAALPGTIYSGKPHFSWYSVPGAVRYRVEVATDEAFTNRVHEADVDTTPLDVLQQLTATGPDLAPGDYFWRVQAIGAAGKGAAFSPPMAFSVRANRRSPKSAYTFGVIGNAYADTASQDAAPADPNAVCPDVVSESAVAICKELPVPVIRHQKDTKMLTLEAPNERPPMGWDEPDTAGYPYCARAGVAMVNAYYRAKLGVPGKLSQDRLGYAAFKDLHPYGGPEYDLPVTGITDHRTSKFLLPLALGTEGVYVQNLYRSNSLNPHPFDQGACIAYAMDVTLQHCVEMGWDAASDECRRYQFSEGPEIQCPPEIAFAWGYEVMANIRREIDAERPIMVTGSGHLFLVVGYVQQGERFYVVDQDTNGRTVTPVSAGGISRSFVSYWTGLAPVKLGSDERSISDDWDDDDVVDFDEVERFETNPYEKDTDADGVNDKDEIHYSVWDPDHGYHKTVIDFSQSYNERPVVAAADQALRGPMEIWKDSDDGGCNDGKENANHDGLRDSGETSNFVKEDDDCGPPPLGGHVHMDYAYSAVREAICTGRVTIDVRFTLDPLTSPTAPDIVHVYRANEMTYDIVTGGCADYPDDGNVFTFDQGFHLAGTMPLTEANLGYAMFLPSRPQFSMKLPQQLTEIGSANTLKGSYTGNGGGPWPAETSVVFEPLSIESNPTHCADPVDASYARPDLLEFCTDPTPCADEPNAPPECFSEPQRYAVIPFKKSFTWDAVNEPGRLYHIADVNVTVEICEGCGSRE